MFCNARKMQIESVADSICKLKQIFQVAQGHDFRAAGKLRTV